MLKISSFPKNVPMALNIDSLLLSENLTMRYSNRIRGEGYDLQILHEFQILLYHLLVVFEGLQNN